MSPSNYQKIPPAAAGKSSFDADIERLAPYFAYFNLGISSLGTAYRAYANGDAAMLAFVSFVVAAYFALEICFRALSRLPRLDDSPKKRSLKIAAWLLSSAILFGFTYQFGTFATIPVTVLVFCVSSATSACIFYVYFVRGDKKITIGENDRHVDAVLEKV